MFFIFFRWYVKFIAAIKTMINFFYRHRKCGKKKTNYHAYPIARFARRGNKFNIF